MRKTLVSLSVLLLVTVGSFFLIRTLYVPLKYEEMIRKYAHQYQVPPTFVASIIRIESGFQANKQGGLMNISEEAAIQIAKDMGMKSFDPSFITHPETNLKLGIWYLGKAYRASNFVTTIKNWTSRNGLAQQKEELNYYVRTVAKQTSYYRFWHGKKLR
ncbi:transglycosylase SLT domain-containing protein [Microbacteriaceae bacterium 4G12]